MAILLVLYDTFKTNIFIIADVIGYQHFSGYTKSFVFFAGNGDIQWCFSQVKGTLDDDVTEGKINNLCFFNFVREDAILIGLLMKISKHYLKLKVKSFNYKSLGY